MTSPNIFYLDALAAVMIALVGFIGVCVGSFAYRYMKGDTNYRPFFVRFGLLAASVMALACVDNLAFLLGAWCFSNALLVRLMMHKPGWKAAKASGLLAAKNYLIGGASVAAAFVVLYAATGETSVQGLIRNKPASAFVQPALVLLLIGALAQSAIWPFHRWLISSLNSPTPVSAVMHAGLVNGGGFLLARFAPLYLDSPFLLTLIFVLGILSALLGTLWKLMQSDVKRMLACSTMGQMGFMLAQCGLGLFPAAVAHLVWHGMFKAYLFLASGGAAQEKRFNPSYPPKPVHFICALICGAAGSCGFMVASGKAFLAGDSTLVLIAVAFLSAAQFAMPMLRFQPLRSLTKACAATGAIGLVYGTNVHLITAILAPMNLMQPQPLNGFHIVGIVLLAFAWLSILFVRMPEHLSQWMLKSYVAAFNASQPHPATVTAHRNHYQYL